MVWLINLFLGFRGRIGRFGFWLGLITIAMVSPFSFWSVFSTDPLNDLMGNVQKLGVTGLIWSLVLIYVMAALITKRLHDRNKPGIYAALVYAPAILQSVTFFLGGKEWASWLQFIYDWSWLIGLELAIVGLWFFVELGLYGAKEPNRYGGTAAEV